MPDISVIISTIGNYGGLRRALDSLEGQSIRDVAQRLQMKEVAVRVALHRGLKALAALHKKDDE